MDWFSAAGLKNIKKDIESIIRYSQEYPSNVPINVAPMLEKWQKAKQKFFDIFAGTFWVDTDLCTVVEFDEEKIFNNFMKEIHKTNNTELVDFFMENKSGFFENKIVKEYPKYHLPKGAKLLKSAKYFVNDEMDNLRVIQDEASAAIQKKKISGCLHFSVDPIDFLTLSENNNNWSSCHSLSGEYRAGNINYMLDETTFIVYLADTPFKHLPCMPEGNEWKDKKWRMLVHMTDDVIYFGRQYPFTIPNIEKTVYNTIQQLCNGFAPREPKHIGIKSITKANNITITSRTKLLDIFGNIINTLDVIHYNRNFLGYKDLIRSTEYDPIISFNAYPGQPYQLIKDKLTINIGADAICPCCGRRKTSLTDNLLCLDCALSYNIVEDQFTRCSVCGRRIYLDEECEMGYHNDIICHRCCKKKGRK